MLENGLNICFPDVLHKKHCYLSCEFYNKGTHTVGISPIEPLSAHRGCENSWKLFYNKKTRTVT